jgi:hypothetical protein
MFKKKIVAGLLMSACLSSVHAEAESIWSALKGGTPTVQLRLRYEDVDNDAGTDQEELSLRTAIGYKTKSYMGFSAYAQLEDISHIDDDDDATSIDNNVSELNQAYLQYSNKSFGATLGRQTIIYDNARHVGNVGWRMNDQTFDAFTLKYTGIENLTFSYNYIWQVNRIFGTQSDSDHHLVNAAYKLSSAKVVAYYYKTDWDTTGFLDADRDTYGAEISGSPKFGSTTLNYSLEYALQSDGGDNAASFDTDYLNAEIGVSVSGYGLKVGYEVLGEDNGTSFTTPLATVHAHNGWSDKAIGTQLTGGAGIEDTYFSIGKSFKSAKLLAVYHDLSADTGTATYDGSEIDLVATYKFKVGPVIGAKAAFFDADTAGQDLSKFWLWTEYKI